MRRDFEKFFVKLQLDYNSITKQKEKIDAEYGKGLLTKEQYSNFITYYNSIKVNYDRVNYVRYLLHKPPKFIENLITKFTINKANKEIKNLNDNTLEENKEILENVEEEFNKE